MDVCDGAGVGCGVDLALCVVWGCWVWGWWGGDVCAGMEDSCAVDPPDE